MPPGDRPQLVFAGLRRLARLLGKTGADDDCGADAAAAAFFEGVRHHRRRHQDHREIGGFRQIGDPGVGAEAEDFAVAAGDRIDPPRIAVADQGAGQPAAQGFAVGGGADHGDAVGRQ